jgi:hypothetical protein
MVEMRNFYGKGDALSYGSTMNLVVAAEIISSILLFIRFSFLPPFWQSALSTQL